MPTTIERVKARADRMARKYRLLASERRDLKLILDAEAWEGCSRLCAKQIATPTDTEEG